MSKITVAGVRQNVKELLDYSNNEKKRNFLETVEVGGIFKMLSSRSKLTLIATNRPQEL
jgi:ribosomal protein L1